jgi:hypothetical protein
MSSPTHGPASSYSDHECSICTEDFSEEHPPVPLDNCRHIFCRDCLQHWRNSNNAQCNNCPECRAPIASEEDNNEDLNFYRARALQAAVQAQQAYQPASVHVQPGAQVHYFDGAGLYGSIYGNRVVYYRQPVWVHVQPAPIPSQVHVQSTSVPSQVHIQPAPMQFQPSQGYTQPAQFRAQPFRAHQQAPIYTPYFPRTPRTSYGIRSRICHVFRRNYQQAEQDEMDDFLWATAMGGYRMEYDRRQRPRWGRDTIFSFERFNEYPY